MTQVAITPNNDKLLDEFNTVVAETQHLLMSVASLGSDRAITAKNLEADDSGPLRLLLDDLLRRAPSLAAHAR